MAQSFKIEDFWERTNADSDVTILKGALRIYIFNNENENDLVVEGDTGAGGTNVTVPAGEEYEFPALPGRKYETKEIDVSTISEGATIFIHAIYGLTGRGV